MANLKTLCEISWEKDGELEEGESTIEKDLYFLLHWGLKHEIVQVEERMLAINWTVAICQNVKTGVIECFAPEQLRILGNEIKK